ncbi:diol dehydratase reactivase subunit alpha [Desulforhopalus sp. 52FAK]
MLIAGVDIGNNSTEVSVARIGREVEFLSSSLVRTIGLKGTLRNAMCVIDAVDKAVSAINMVRADLDLILLNKATPVIGDVAMETITETIITESAMIGHNPSTPGGLGLGVGITVDIYEAERLAPSTGCIVVVDESVNFNAAASMINQAFANGVKVVGAVVKKDDGVLINNRLDRLIPIVDEVKHIDKVPMGMPAALEVAQVGRSIEKLSNPYDIATLFELSPEETRQITPIARALTGNRSGVVIKTPKGDIRERRIPAGSITLIGEKRQERVSIEDGADAIMEKLAQIAPLVEIQSESGTNAGGMFERVRTVMADLTDQPVSLINIQDVLAVNTLQPQHVLGALAGEFTKGSAVGLAAMVMTQNIPMQRLAKKINEEIAVPVEIGGVEAEMAILGALTTPGTEAPLAVLDLGGGSTDASIIHVNGDVKSIHMAGAGDMVTMLINTELGLDDIELAEEIKRYPLAKVETLFHIRHENGSVEFFDTHLDPALFGRVAIMTETGPVPILHDLHLNQIANVRRKAKEKVFVCNALRALAQVAPNGNIRLIHFVALVGGSALDFEIPEMISDALEEYGVVLGKGNIRGCEGPRNAVATGLCLSRRTSYVK